MGWLQDFYARDQDWKPEPKEAAAVYRWPDRFLVHAVVATAGASMAHEPYIRLPSEASATELGLAVVRALKVAGGVVGNWEASKTDKGRRALLKAAGVRSWKRFHEACHYCDVGHVQERVTVTPPENSCLTGRHKSFAFLPDAEVSCDAGASPDVIGDAVLLGLSRCTPAL